MLSNLFGKKNKKCPQAGLCSGCEWIDSPLNKQVEQKVHNQQNLLKEYNIPYSNDIDIVSIGETSNRVFVDVSFQRTEQGDSTILGLYDVEREQLVNVGRCPATTTDLQDFLEALSTDPPPIDRASFRLRVNPHGQWGMWIDAANIDIRTLLNEGQWLERWMKTTHIELGQKRKYLQHSNGRLKLEAPFPRQWFKTFLPSQNQEFILWSVVGGFSQPNDHGIKHLVNSITQLISPHQDLNTWLEFGSGSGTFTLPLAQIVKTVIATESSPIARKALDKALHHHSIQNVEVSPINIQRQSESSVALVEKADALFVDPPRSGLGHTLLTLEKSPKKPSVILYISCHGRTLCKDGEKLRTMGYELTHLQGVDQFPNTPHCEWVSLWTLQNT